MITQIAADLTAWTRLLGCIGDVATLATCEPKALRYRFFHVPARLAHSARRRRLKIPESWPWAAAVFANIAAIPQPARPGPSAPNITTRRTAARQSQPARRRTRSHSAHGRTRPHGSDTIPTAVMKDRG